jgi:hypothetical protein
MKAQTFNSSFIFKQIIRQFKGESIVFKTKKYVNNIYWIFTSKESLSSLSGSLEGLGDGSASC